MGHFTMRCSISGLPIGGGDDMVWVPLLKLRNYDDPFQADWTAWSPGIRTTYDSYGGPDDVQSPLKGLFVQYLQECLVEKGTGDNQCHDVPVQLGMSFEEYTTAIGENRLEIKAKDQSWREGLLPVPEVPAHVPTLQSVSALLGGDYLVDVLPNGVVRVRVAGYGENGGKIQSAKQTLDVSYTTAHIPGTGSYAHESELWVFTQVAEGRRNEQIRESEATEEPKTAPIVHGMVRADVWDMIVSTPFQVRYPSSKGGFDAVKASVQNAWKRMESIEVLESHPLTAGMGMASELYDLERGFLASILTSESFCDFGTIWGAFQCAFEHTAPEHKEEVIQAFAETLYVGRTLYILRKRWEPTSYLGPQETEWKLNALYTSKIAEIARTNYEESGEDEDNEDEE